MNLIEEKMNSLWGAVIKEYFYDITNNRLDLSLDRLNMGIHSLHSISIGGITSLCIQNEIDSKGHVLQNYLELTSIAFANREGVDVKEIGKRCVPNIIIEISDASFSITAKEIKIDDVGFEF